MAIEIVDLLIYPLKNMIYPENGWFIIENTINMDDFEVPPFQETSICILMVLNS